MDEVIQQVINQFPDREILIRRLWDIDEDFRDLCQDYTLCLETLAHRSTNLATPTRMAEYRCLRQQLEFEIDMRIRNVQPQRD